MTDHIDPIPPLSERTLRLIECGTSMELSDPSDHALTFLPWLLCQVSLPYRDPGPDVHVWTRHNGGVELRIIADVDRDGHAVWPWGVVPRLVLMWLTDQIVKGTTAADGRVIHLGDSLRQWLTDLDLDTGGRQIARVRSQVDALANARFALIRDATTDDMLGYERENIQVADSAVLLWRRDTQALATDSRITVSMPFFEMIKTSSVPLEVEVIRALRGRGSSGMSLDIYTWLKCRLTGTAHGRKSLPIVIPWTRIAQQFGASYARLRAFRSRFMEATREVEVACCWGAAWFPPRFHCVDTGRAFVIRTGIHSQD